jgi:hypothetical protein
MVGRLVAGDEISNRSSARTVAARRWVISTCRRIIAWIAATPSSRIVSHSLRARNRRPSGTCQSR